MPFFALPLPNNSAAPLPRPSFAPVSIPRRKRKRATSDSPDENSSPEPESDYTHHVSTNPLSLTPAEIVQYRLAGLEINEDLPSQGIDAVKDFPHRALSILPTPKETKSRHKGKGKERAQEDGYDIKIGGQDEDIDHKRRGPGLHLRHLSVLTTILHRCLLAGDIPRASRAWAILIREQFWGQSIDIKGSGYWAIGAELLIRSGERRPRNDEVSDNEQSQRQEGEAKRWGSAEGWKKARAYYEQLILQYPYRRQFQHNTSALDFWPAMLGCEFYGIQWEEKEQLKRLERLEKGGSDDMDVDDLGPSEESEASSDAQDDTEFAAQRKTSRRIARAEEKAWQAKEAIRQKSLGAAEVVAARMDTLMTNHPYMDSRALLRLRAMLALYIGDLHLPNLIQDGEAEDGYYLRSYGKDSERRFLLRQRQANYRNGRESQKEQRALANKLLDKIFKKGGWVGDINYLELEDDGDEEVHDHAF